MNNKQETQTPKIIREDNGTYSVTLKIEDKSRGELEKVFKRAKQAEKWTDEHCKNNIGNGFRKGKIKKCLRQKS